VERRLAAILAADIAGYSRLTGVDEEGTIARIRTLRQELIDPTIAAHRGRIVKTTGDGILIEFASVVDAVRCAVEVQRGVTTRNTNVPADKRIEFRMGINLGDVVVEGDDLLGDGVNVAARLEGIAAPGAICLSGDAYRQIKGKIDLAVQDRGEQRLKNIAERVRVYALSPASAPSTASAARHGDGRRVRRDLRTRRRADRAAGRELAAAPLASPRASSASTAATSTRVPRLSVVVLPFANLGSDKEQDYFVDGITENLTTDLSRIPGAIVIARNTAFTFKGKAVDARQIGRELGVRYVMEGSVQSGGNRIRVNAQLIDTETGAHIWAERFEKPRADLFDMQDEITARLARTIGVELIAAEGRRAERERPDNMDAVDLSMRGWAMMNQLFTVDRARDARGLFEAALRLDECNVDALVGLAYSCVVVVRVFALAKQDDEIRAADTAIAKALKLAPNNAFAHLVRGMALHISRAPEPALREAELAVSLDPNLAWAHVEVGFNKALLGRGEETEAHVAEAMRLSPRDPALDRWYTLLGVANFLKGDLDRAVECLRNAVHINPNVALPFFFLAAALALTDRSAEAAQACLYGCRLDPRFSVSGFIKERRSDHPVFLTQRARIYDGMRKAGIPEE